MFNQRGGIISKLFIIPLGVALMVGFFFLGYYVGGYQAKKAPEQLLPSLPEVGADMPYRQEDFTFYKTLTERDDKTVSIDLKPKKNEISSAGMGRQGGAEPEKKIEIKIDKKQAETPKQIEKSGGKPEKSAVQAVLRYTIQVASYNERGMAEEEVRRMKKRGYAAFIVSSELPEKGTWYRVRVGSFSTRSSAERLLNELKTKEGLSPFITTE